MTDWEEALDGYDSLVDLARDPGFKQAVDDLSGDDEVSLFLDKSASLDDGDTARELMDVLDELSDMVPGRVALVPDGPGYDDFWEATERPRETKSRRFGPDQEPYDEERNASAPDGAPPLGSGQPEWKRMAAAESRIRALERKVFGGALSVEQEMYLEGTSGGDKDDE